MVFLCGQLNQYADLEAVESLNAKFCCLFGLVQLEIYNFSVLSGSRNFFVVRRLV
jgi:hypothetical protein